MFVTLLPSYLCEKWERPALRPVLVKIKHLPQRVVTGGWPLHPCLMSAKPWRVEKSALFLQSSVLKNLEGDGIQIPWIRTEHFKVKYQCSHADELPMQHRHGQSTSPYKLFKLNYSFITQILRSFMVKPLEIVLQCKYLSFSEIFPLWVSFPFTSI